MNVISLLVGEHAVLYTFLDHVQKFAIGWDLHQLKQYGTLLESLLMIHARMEDEHFFNNFTAEHTGLCSALNAMHAEHRDLGRLLREIQEVEADPAEARALFSDLTDLAKEHFALEERILFPLVAESVPEAILCQWGREWAARRRIQVPVA